MIRLNPYLGFTGKAREAIEFYKSVFGGKLTITSYKEGGMSHGPEDDNKTMHAMLEADNGIVLMASDAPHDMPHDTGASISISLSGENADEATLKGYWDKLSEGATITQPLNQAPWGDTFGMLTDKFGTNWMVNIAGKKA